MGRAESGGDAPLFRKRSPGWWILIRPQTRNHLAVSALQIAAPPAGCDRVRGIQMKTKTRVKTATMPAGLPVKVYLAIAAVVLAWLAIPHIGHAQGIVRGAQEGSYEGNRVAGPIGGAMGAVKGVFGINDRGYRCRGYYSHHHFHCYR
jgi:hypothetical protein